MSKHQESVYEVPCTLLPVHPPSQKTVSFKANNKQDNAECRPLSIELLSYLFC